MDDILKELSQKEYKDGFVKRSERRYNTAHLRKEGRAAVAAGLPPGRIPQMAEDDPSGMGPPETSQDRFPGHHILGGAEARRGQADRDRPGPDGDLRQARHPPPREGGARRGETQEQRGGGRRVRFGERGHHLPQDPRGERHHLLLLLRGRARIPRAGPQISCYRGALGRQLLRLPELRSVLRRLLLLHTQGRQVPDGPFELLPHQRPRHRTVRAHADRGRRGVGAQLHGGLHRPDARRAPARTPT